MEKHAWPWPDIFDYSPMREQCARYQGYVVMYEGADLFTRPCILRNMENVMLDMVERPEMVHFLIDKFTSFYCEDISRALEATNGGFDMYCEWSDFGTQRGLLISVPMFREFLAPYLKRMIDLCHGAGLKFMLHSCGAIRELIPDLIALGVDVLDPIQVAAKSMDPGALKREFGDRLAFHGGVCTQRTLPFGTPAEVQAAVRDRIATLGAGGGTCWPPATTSVPIRRRITSWPCTIWGCGASRVERAADLKASSPKHYLSHRHQKETRQCRIR